MLPVGTHTLSATFTPTDLTRYTTATATQTLVVNAPPNAPPVAPVLTWAAPAPITQGTALGATQLNATANVPGTFVYSPAAGVVLPVGTHTLSVTFTPADLTRYLTAAATQTLVVTTPVLNSVESAQDTAGPSPGTEPVNVAPTAPVLTWAAPAPITQGTPLGAAQLNAIANVPGTFSYSPAAGVVLPAGRHVLTVTFTSADLTRYTFATATQSLVVNPPVTTPVLKWAAPAPITQGTPLGAEQLNATASVAGTFSYSPAAGTLLAAGSHTLSVTFTSADQARYTFATASQTLVVNPPATTPAVAWVAPSQLIPGSLPGAQQTNESRTTPVLTWTAPAPIMQGTPLGDEQLNATASVPGTFSYSPAMGAVLAAGGARLTVTFTPEDLTRYTEATASRELLVEAPRATPAIIWPTPSPVNQGTPLGREQLNATAGESGTFAYSPAAGTILPAGTHTLMVTFMPDDPTRYNTATASQKLVVNGVLSAPILTWAALVPITEGTPLGAGQLNATASVPGTFSYSPAAGTVLPAGTTMLTVTFTPADQTRYTTITALRGLVVNAAR